MYKCLNVVIKYSTVESIFDLHQVQPFPEARLVLDDQAHPENKTQRTVTTRI